MAGHLLFNSGSNESSLAPQFKWLDNTFKGQKKVESFLCGLRYQKLNEARGLTSTKLALILEKRIQLMYLQYITPAASIAVTTGGTSLWPCVSTETKMKLLEN